MRKEIVGFVDQIKHKGSTNIYDAIHKGMELIMERPPNCNREAAIMFFTDGQPNCGKYSSTKSIIENLNLEKVKMGFKYPIHTFAFGQYTACTSDLLLAISNNFDGMFGYIQDAKTLGTIFINGIAYTLTNAATSVLMQVEVDGKKILPLQKDLVEPVLDSVDIKLPGLRYGQTADALFSVKGLLSNNSKLKVILSVVHKGKQEFPVEKDIKLQKCSL